MPLSGASIGRVDTHGKIVATRNAACWLSQADGSDPLRFAACDVGKSPTIDEAFTCAVSAASDRSDLWRIGCTIDNYRRLLKPDPTAADEQPDDDNPSPVNPYIKHAVIVRCWLEP
jgi:hypothetical protein